MINSGGQWLFIEWLSFKLDCVLCFELEHLNGSIEWKRLRTVDPKWTVIKTWIKTSFGIEVEIFRFWIGIESYGQKWRLAMVKIVSMSMQCTQDSVKSRHWSNSSVLLATKNSRLPQPSKCSSITAKRTIPHIIPIVCTATGKCISTVMETRNCSISTIVGDGSEKLKNKSNATASLVIIIIK